MSQSKQIKIKIESIPVASTMRAIRAYAGASRENCILITKIRECLEVKTFKGKERKELQQDIKDLAICQKINKRLIRSFQRRLGDLRKTGIKSIHLKGESLDEPI